MPVDQRGAIDAPLDSINKVAVSSGLVQWTTIALNDWMTG